VKKEARLSARALAEVKEAKVKMIYDVEVCL